MYRYLTLAACCVPLFLALAGPLGAAEPGEAGRLEDFRAHWECETLGLAQWPPETAYDADTGTVEFTGSRGQRLRAHLVFPTYLRAETGAVLHLGQARAITGSGNDLIHMYLPVENRLTDPRRALLDAYQAVTVLLSAPGVAAGKVAVMGRGEAAALAVALAALRPAEIGCVVSLDPQVPGVGRRPWDLAAFAGLVRCPTLVVVEGRADSAGAVAVLQRTLAGPHELIRAPGVAETAGLAWAALVLAQPAAVPASRAQEEPALIAGGLPVDLSEQ